MTDEKDEVRDSSKDMSAIAQYREWFRAAVDKAQEWREEAREDYEFMVGKQWTDADKLKLAESGRPAIKINRIRTNRRRLWMRLSAEQAGLRSAISLTRKSTTAKLS